MIRFLSAAFLAAAPLAAAGADTLPYYSAVPAAQPSKTSFVTRNTPWHLSNGALVASRAPERDMVLCQLVVARAGALQSFSVAGKSYDDTQLAQCNGRARRAAGDATAIAR